MTKSLIIGLTVLSLMLCANTAFPIEEPSQTVVFPFICQVTSQKGKLAEHLDMIFTIANVTDTNLQFGSYVYYIIRNYKSQAVIDWSLPLSPYDVASKTCSGEISKMSSDNKSMMIQIIGGKRYYVGYSEYNVEDTEAYLIGWGQMETLSKFKGPHPSTDTGFNGVPDFYDDVNAATIITGTVGNGVSWNIDSNQRLMPRFKIANDDPDTHNWWIIMTPSDALDTSIGSCTRKLDCYLCNENELCISSAISIPYQVNIVNVADYLPSSLFPTFPKSGFAMCDVVLQGISVFSSTAVNPCGNAGNEQYLGWSYMYTQDKYDLRTALIFPIHRQINWPVGQ